MNIAVDISPLKSGHKVRGTGFYLTHLKDALLQYCSKNIYHFFSSNEKIPKNVDIVHYPYFDPFFLTLPFIKKYKSVVTVHDLTPLIFPHAFPTGKKGMIKWQIQKNNLKRFEAIITDSYSSKDDIARICGIDKNKIHVVYLAAGEQFKQIKKSEIEQTRKKYELPQEFVLYVGDVTWNKNLPRLVDAVTRINKPLIMVGKALTEKNVDTKNAWNKDLVIVQEMITNNSLVKTLGFVPTEDLIGIYNAASMLVMPSLYEGFGLPILEAMSCGCPVVATKEGSLNEVVGDAGLMVDAYNSQSIQEGIVRLFEDKKLREIYKEKGLEQVKKFSWEKTAKETMHIYELVTGKQV